MRHIPLGPHGRPSGHGAYLESTPFPRVDVTPGTRRMTRGRRPGCVPFGANVDPRGAGRWCAYWGCLTFACLLDIIPAAYSAPRTVPTAHLLQKR